MHKFDSDYEQHIRKLDSIVTRDLGFVTIIDISGSEQQRKSSIPNQVDRSDEVSARERMISRLPRSQSRRNLQTANGCNAEIRYDQNLTDRARENLERDLMIARMRKGRHPVMAEFSEQEARELYIERLKSRKSERR